MCKGPLNPDGPEPQHGQSQHTLGMLNLIQRCRVETDMSVERRVRPVFVLFRVGINQDSRGSLSGGICNLKHIYLQKQHISLTPQGEKNCSINTNLLSKGDLPCSQQQHAAFQANVAVLNHL